MTRVWFDHVSYADAVALAKWWNNHTPRPGVKYRVDMSPNPKQWQTKADYAVIRIETT